MTGYGLAAWPTRLAPIPQAHESAIIARVQSMRTRNGRVQEPLSYAASVTYLRNVERVRKHHVTTPQPLHAGPVGAVHTSPERAQTSGTHLPAGAQAANSQAARAGRQSFTTGDAA